MKDSTYQHMCTILVGVASLFRYTGYDMATFIVTSLTHSAHLRNPSAIIDNAGYYGQAVKEMSSCLSFFIVPIILNYIKPKWALVVGSGLFAFYIATFFYINTYLYFSANVLLGVAFTLIYTAFSTYQLQFSTRKTLARNSATAYGIAGFSLLFGGALYIYVTTAHSETAHEAVAVGTQQYRYYSEAETRTMCGFLFACCLISLLIHALLPNKEIPNSLASESPHEKLTLTKQVGVTASVLTNSYILMFIPRFLNYGLFMSFYMNIYPTSLQFSTILASRHPMLTAYYAIAMCAGIAIGGLIIARLNHSFHDFGLRPLYYITMALQLVTYGIAVLTVPNRSTAQPTDDSALTESHLIWVLMVAFLLGFTDSAQNASNTVLCSRLIPGRAAHTYAAARFFVGIAASLIFFCSPLLTMTMHAIILTSTTVSHMQRNIQKGLSPACPSISE